MCSNKCNNNFYELVLSVWTGRVMQRSARPQRASIMFCNDIFKRANTIK
jgi:hypothetical protein